MKVVILQPPYFEGKVEKITDWIFKSLTEIKGKDINLVLLPEYSNCPGIIKPLELKEYVKNNNKKFFEKLKDEAKRLGCIIAAGVIVEENEKWYNRGIMLDEKGKIVFSYNKIHLTEAEEKIFNFTSGSNISVFNYRGIKFAFALCFDIYFSQYIDTLAENNIDIILSPSYQRTEIPERIEVISQTRSIDSGSYLVRSSYAMPDAKTGGYSLICAPWGEIIVKAGNQPEILTGSIKPEEKWIKPSSYKQPSVSHIKLIKHHKRTFIYYPFSERKKIARNFPFPRICAHRGLSGLCPENTLPSFASSIAVGCDEIEFDVHLSKDGVFVICHDETVDRTTDGKGKISELSWNEIKEFDAGVKFGEEWKGIRIPSLEEVIALVDYKVGLNIHIKFQDSEVLKVLYDYLREKALVEISYLAIGDINLLEEAVKFAPEIDRCCLVNQENPDEMLKIAREFKCRRVQFSRNVEKKHIEIAHSEGIICNLFFSDSLEDAKKYVEIGIDVILSNFSNRLLPLKGKNL